MPDITIGGVTLRFKGDRKQLNASISLTEKQIDRLQQRHKIATEKQKQDIRTLQAAYNAHNRELRKAATSFGNITKNANAVSSAYRTQNTALSKSTTATNTLNANFRTTSRTSGNLNRNIKNSQELFRSFNRELRKAVQVLAGLSAKQFQAAISAKAVATSNTQVTAALSTQSTKLKSLIAQYGIFGGVLSKTVAALNRGKATTLGFDRSITQILLTLAQYAAATALITGGIVVLGNVTFKAAAEFEQAFIGVGKTVEGIVETTGVVTELGLQLQQRLFSLARSLPTSVEELSKIAEIAGQLGVRGVNNISRFVDAVAKLDISTNLGFEQAALDLGRFINVTGFNNPNALGSILVRLGNNFATLESEILDYGKRLSGAGTSAGLAAHEILAFGAAASALGRLPESGATSIQVIFLEIFKAIQLGGEELKVFGNIAGRTADQFRRLFAQSPGAAITQFIRGFAADPATNLRSLGDIGITSRRLNATLLAFANNTGLLTSALAAARDEASRGTALGEEVAKFVSTFYSQLGILRNNLNLIAIELSSNVLPVLTSMTRGLNDLFKSGREQTALLLVVSSVFGTISAVLGSLFLLGRAINFVGVRLNYTILAASKFGRGAGNFALIFIAVGLAIDAIVLLAPALGTFLGSVNEYQRRLREIARGAPDTDPIAQNVEVAYSDAARNVGRLAGVTFLNAFIETFKTAIINSSRLGEFFRETARIIIRDIVTGDITFSDFSDRIREIRDSFTNIFDRPPLASTQFNLGNVGLPSAVSSLGSANLQLRPLPLDVDFVERAEAAFAKFELRIRTLRGQLQGFNTVRATRALTDFRRAIGTNFDLIFDNISEIAPRLRQIADSLGIDVLNGLERAALVYDDFITSINAQADDLGQKIIAQFLAENSAAQRYDQTLGELISNLQGLNDAQSALQISQLSDALTQGTRDFEQFGDAQRFVNLKRSIADIALALRRAGKELGDDRLFGLSEIARHNELVAQWEKSVEEIRQKAINRLRDSFGTFFESLLSGTRSWSDTFSRAIQSLTAQLASLALQNLAIRPLLDSLTQIGVFSRLGGIFGGGASVAAPVRFVGPPIPGAQHGGIRRGLTLVGEAGPELVNFRQPTRVTTNNDLREAFGSMGGNVFNFSPIIQSSDDAAIRRALSEAFPVFEKRIESIVGRNLSRPSSLRKNVTGR